MGESSLGGLYTALITPFRNNEVDYDALAALVDSQIQAGVDGIVVLGTTGEFFSLSTIECAKIIDFVGKKKGNLQLIVATGRRSSDETFLLSQYAARNGADALVVIPPFFSNERFGMSVAGKKMPAEQGVQQVNFSDILDFFSELRTCVDCELMYYNIPQNSGIQISPGMAQELAKIVPLVKDATRDISSVEMFKKAGFEVFAGSDSLLKEGFPLGLRGVITATSNFLSELFVEIVHEQQVSERNDAVLADFRKLREGGPYAYIPLLKLLAGYPAVRAPLETITDRQRLLDLIEKSPSAPVFYQALYRNQLLADLLPSLSSIKQATSGLGMPHEACRLPAPNRI